MQVTKRCANNHHTLIFNINETKVTNSTNKSTISWSIQLSADASWSFSQIGSTIVAKINGVTVYNQYAQRSCNGGATVTWASGTLEVEHNSDGSKNVNFECSYSQSSTANYTPGNASLNGTLTLTKIPRYTSIKAFSVSKRSETSVTFNWETADTIDYVWYSKDNGSNWTGLDVADGTSGSFNIGSLSPNTKYNFKLRVRRKDSQLTTDSTTVVQTTYKIPTQSLNQKTETTIKVNWNIDSTADRIQYSKDNGKTWSTAITVNATSGNYTISGLTPNTTYSIKTRIRRSGSQTIYDTTTLSVTTYKAPTQSLASKTETNITMNWACDSAVDYLSYSKDNGSTWTGMSIADKTSGTYTITELTANTKYNIKTRIRRKATQTSYDTSNLEVTTYDYPYCTESPNFTIGTAFTLKFYNPLRRSISITGIGADGTVILSGNTSGTSLTGFNDNGSVANQYKSIPNSKSGTYQVKVSYGSITKTRNNGNTYSIKGDEVPVFSNFTYEDSKATVVAVTGNKSFIVKNQSTLKIIISSANKMVAQKSAMPKRYEVSCGNRLATINYATTDVSVDLGTISVAGNTDIIVKAYDSRGLSTTKKTTINVIDYANIVQKNTFARLNNFENETTLIIKGSFSLVNCGETNKNTIQSVRYRYAKISNEYSSTWLSLTPTVNSNGYTAPNVTLDLDNQSSWKIQVEIKDKFTTSTVELTVSEGIPILYLNTSKKNAGIGKQNTSGEPYSLALAGDLILKSGNIALDYDIVDEW